jgi:hypothetical protein
VLGKTTLRIHRCGWSPTVGNSHSTDSAIESGLLCVDNSPADLERVERPQQDGITRCQIGW